MLPNAHLYQSSSKGLSLLPTSSIISLSNTVFMSLQLPFLGLQLPFLILWKSINRRMRRMRVMTWRSNGFWRLIFVLKCF